MRKIIRLLKYKKNLGIENDGLLINIIYMDIKLNTTQTHNSNLNFYTNQLDQKRMITLISDPTSHLLEPIENSTLLHRTNFKL